MKNPREKRSPTPGENDRKNFFPQKKKKKGEPGPPKKGEKVFRFQGKRKQRKKPPWGEKEGGKRGQSCSTSQKNGPGVKGMQGGKNNMYPPL